MDYQIITESHPALLVLCLLTGAGLSFLLYRKDTTFESTTKWLKIAMAFFRFAVISVLCVLLLSPLVRSITRETGKPLIVVLQDNSRSIVPPTDTSLFKKNHLEKINALKEQLDELADVRVLSIGEQLKDGFDGSFKDYESDLSFPVNELRARYTGSNLSAVVLLSDGLYNKGNDPNYTFPALQVPVYTVGMGDTTIRKDVSISSVRFNKSVFLGNTFPVEISINAREFAGQKLKVSIFKDSDLLIEREIIVSSRRFTGVTTLMLEAKEKGINHYTAKVSVLEGESNTENNKRDLYIEVSSEKYKVLLVYNAPHPDIAAIRSVLEINPNYEIKDVAASEFNGTISSDTRLVIMYQIPSKTGNSDNVLTTVKKSGIPVLYILGNGTSIPALNKLELPIKISENNGTSGEARGALVSTFSLFSMEDEYTRRISNFAPLYVPFGNYNLRKAGYSIMNQMIGNVKTEIPLLSFFPDEDSKTAILCGEGIWKWRLNDYAANGNCDAFNSLILKSIQYLATADKKKPFKLIYKNSYNQNEPVIFDAELYNPAGEPVSNADVTITFSDDKNKEFSYTFSQINQSYTLNAGFFNPGIYKFTAKAKLADGTILTEAGSIAVTALQSEMAELVADHGMLRSLSEKTGGKFYSLAALDSLVSDLKSRQDIKPVIYTRKSLTDAINLKWIFIMLITFLSAEWFFRKRSGGY